MEKKKENILFETSNGTVKANIYTKRLKILYQNIVFEQSYHGFKYLLGNLNSLYTYVNDVGQLYYRRFLIDNKKYRLSFSLNSREVSELYELLGGAKTMLELQNIIEERLYPDNKKI